MTAFLLPGRRLAAACAVVAASLATGGTRLAGADDLPDFLMHSDPSLTVPSGRTALPEGAVRLWCETLLRPEPELVKAAAASIAAAHEQGFPGLSECIPALRESVRTVDLHPDAALTICRALIVLEAREAADALRELAQRGGTAFRLLIEPALADWDDPAIRDLWRARLLDEGTHHRELILACSGLATVRDASASPLLVAIARDRTRPPELRLAAARSAGQIAAAGLETEAAALALERSHGLIDDLCALWLIRRHTSEEARQLLLRLAVHRNPTVAAPALRALLEIDPKLVLPLAAKALNNDDPDVRQCGLEAFTALVTQERIALIAAVLDDPHPDVRVSARRALQRFGTGGQFDAAVRDAAMTALEADGWRSQQQAALLLGQMEHKPAALRLVELLESDRAEVMTAAAWALRKLAAPETADAILDRVRRVSDHLLAASPADRRPGFDAQAAHLFEALAVLNDVRGTPVMRRHVPRDITRETSRSAAIWALGRLLEGQPDDELAGALMGRIRDVNSIPPERDLVRRMSAVAIGRMSAVSRLEDLQSELGEFVNPNEVDHALAWSVERMNGVVPPPLPPVVEIRRGWLIEPAPARETR